VRNERYEGRIDVQRLDPPPAGFPDCTACPYLVTGTPDICSSCVASGEPDVAGPVCELCGEPLRGAQECPNTVCTLEDPWFSRIHTVSSRSEDVWTAVCRYKYDEDRDWAPVLGRLLVGHLDEHRAVFERYDLITTGALYVGPRARRLWDHLRLVLDAAQTAGPDWPFVPDLITKSGPTGQFLGRGVETRRAIAEHSLREALAVPDPQRVVGRRVLVVDDVYSEGFSLREMARVLRLAGAAEVAGLVFARKKGG
jgi:predicted amidophosphoribosyltransferase